MKKIEVPIEVSARHIHLSEQDSLKLFGSEYNIQKMKDVSQPNQYASSETLKLVGPKGNLENVRIIMPFREKTQIEISVTDSYKLGIEIPEVRMSGDLEGTKGGIEIVGPKGSINLQTGVIVAQRHLHIQPEIAKKYGLKHKDVVKILIEGKRALIFENVIVRSRESIDKLSFQVDTDEANAAGIYKQKKGYLIYG